MHQCCILTLLLQAAAAFALGADGIALGSRLLVTYESEYPEDKQNMLLQAGSDACREAVTIRTSLYDQISGEAWPSPVNGHCLRNQLTAQYGSDSKLKVTYYCLHRLKSMLGKDMQLP